MRWLLFGLSSWLVATSAASAVDLSPRCLLSLATSLKTTQLPIDEEGFRAEDVFCPYTQTTHSPSVPNAHELASSTIEELYRLAFHDTSPRSNKTKRDRLARVFNEEEGVSSFHAKKCAVVSNSGVLLSHKYGEEIDASDLVFRFNDAEVTEQFAAFAGLHDDIRVLQHEATYHLLTSALRVRLSHSQDTVYVAQRINKKASRAYTRWKDAPRSYQDLHVALGSFDVQKVSQQVLHKAYGHPPDGAYGPDKERFVTTGFLGIVLAMAMCDEVHAYGFLDSPTSVVAPYHYYGTKSSKTMSDLDDELNHYHPTYDQEKHFWRVTATNRDGDATDISVIPGFSSLKCN
mmetsp:Transcript_6938/g.12334  ORF Transcript_6938/g.12334 Transcript_6938/m.12334 type:complete len:346 (-) Transcript_6938:163-1200(-)